MLNFDVQPIKPTQDIQGCSGLVALAEVALVVRLRVGRCRPLMFLEELDHQRTQLDMIGGLVSAGGGSAWQAEDMACSEVPTFDPLCEARTNLPILWT
jgi:hypothetical protein